MGTESSLHLVRHTDQCFVQQFVADAQQSDKVMLNLFAPRGTGKSDFLYSVYKQYQLLFQSLFVKITKINEIDQIGAVYYEELLITIWNQLDVVATDHDSMEFPREEDSSTHVLPALGSRTLALAQQIVKRIGNSSKRMILLFDDYDALSKKIRQQFETDILSQLLKHSIPAIVLMTSERQLRFEDRLDLRTRLTAYRLNLTMEDLLESMPVQHFELSPELVRLTGGVAGLVTHLFSEFQKQQIDTPTEYYGHRKDLFGKKYREQIQSIVFPDVRIVNGAMDVLALLRRFDATLLASVLPELKPTIFSGFKTYDYQNLLCELGSRIQWQSHGGYMMDEMIKVMLASYVRVFEKDLFEDANRLVASVYEDWLSHNFRPHYLIELLFHRVVIKEWKQYDRQEIANYVNRTLRSQLTRHDTFLAIHREQMQLLKEGLLSDIDLKPYIDMEVISIIDKR